MAGLTSSGPIQVSAFLALTFGIIAYFFGAGLTRHFRILSAYSIPEPVTGGLVAAILALVVVYATGRVVVYDLAARDALLVYFFTTIGLKARLDDLWRGGPVLGIMLGLTVVYMAVQSLVGLGVATTAYAVTKNPELLGKTPAAAEAPLLKG